MTRVRGPYHTGFVVPSLDAAMEEFSRVLGLEWREVREATLRIPNRRGAMIEGTSRFVHSQGAPSIELFEGIPDTILEGGDRPRFHHIGFWADDLRTCSAHVDACGWAYLHDATAVTPPPAAFHEAPFGFLELWNVDYPRGDYYADLAPTTRPAPGR